MKKKYNIPTSTVYGFNLRDGILQSASQLSDGTNTPGGDSGDFDPGVGGSGSGDLGGDDLSRQDNGGNSIWDNVW